MLFVLNMHSCPDNSSIHGEGSTLQCIFITIVTSCLKNSFKFYIWKKIYVRHAVPTLVFVIELEAIGVPVWGTGHSGNSPPGRVDRSCLKPTSLWRLVGYISLTCWFFCSCGTCWRVPWPSATVKIRDETDPLVRTQKIKIYG